MVRVIQRLHRGEGPRRIRCQGLAGILVPVLVPDLQYRTHGDVHPALGLLTPFLGKGKHLQQLRLHLHWGHAGIQVDGADVVHPGILVEPVVKLAQLLEPLMDGPGVALKFLLGFGIADDLDNGIKGIIKLGAVPGVPRVRRASPSWELAASCPKGQDRRQEQRNPSLQGDLHKTSPAEGPPAVFHNSLLPAKAR